MTTDTDTAPVPADPLAMARNCVAAVTAAAAIQASADPEQQLLAHVHHVGAQGDQASKVAARMALVSIAEDLRAGNTPRPASRQALVAAVRAAAEIVREATSDPQLRAAAMPVVVGELLDFEMPADEEAAASS